MQTQAAPGAGSPERGADDRFRWMMESAPVMVWIAAADGRVEWFSNAWLEFTGRTLAQEAGSGWFDSVHPEDLERCAGIWHTSFEARQPFSMDFRLRRHDASWRWVMTQGVPRHGPDGGFHGYSGSCVDIHERKALEERLAERTRALRIADRRKDEFIAMLSHDLRNPLGPIANAVALMQLMERDTPAVAPVRQIVERQLEQLRRVIADMREVTRITQAKIELHRQPLAVADFVHQAIAATRELFEARGHRLQLAMPGVPPHVQGDAMRLAQALAHLLTNAAKFTPEPAQIDLGVEVDAAALHIRVKDPGQGIQPDFLPHVFEPFAQESHSRPRTGSGLGVGLTIAKRLVELHGGALEAASDGPGRGATFTMSLPLIDHATPHDGSAQANAATGGRGQAMPRVAASLA